MANTYNGRVQINGVLNRGVLNLRQTMNVNSTSLAEMDDGTMLKVTLASDKEWFKATYLGQIGYVQAANIAIVGEADSLYRVNVTTGTLNIRKKPSTSAEVAFTAAKGRGLYVLETSGDWYLVSCNIGTGWASKTYLDKDRTVVPFDYLTPEEFIARLDSFCDCGWTYGAGYSSSGKYIDCSNYPYVARHSLGEKGATSEYNSISVGEKGTISDFSQLQVGMEVFQSNPDNSAIKEHMGVYAGLKQFPNGEVLHAVYQSRATYSSSQQAMYSERLGPNLTEMNNNWDYWAWSKYIQHES